MWRFASQMLRAYCHSCVSVVFCQSLCRSLVSACFHPMYGLLVNSLAHSACQRVLPVYNQLILPLPKTSSLLPTPVPTLGHTSKQGDFLLLLQL